MTVSIRRGTPSFLMIAVAAEASGGETIAPSRNATGHETPSPSARTATATRPVVKRIRPKARRNIESRLFLSTILEVAPRREKCRIEKDWRKKEFEGDRRIQNQPRQTRQQAEGQATKYQENFNRHAGTARPGNGHRCNEQEQQRRVNDTHKCPGS